MNYALFRPVHRRLAGDPRLEFEFAGRDGRSRRPEEMYRSAGLEGGRVVHTSRMRLARYDMFIACNFRTLPWRARWKIQTYHGLSPVNSFLKKPHRIMKYDRLFLYGPHMKRRLVETGALAEGDPRMMVIGWPKLDALVDGSLDRDGILSECGLDPARRTVLYAPGCKERGSLAAGGEAIARALAEMDLNVLVKLHDRSRDPAFCGCDWGQRLAALGLPGVHLAAGCDPAPYLFAADLMITDVSSISYEYCVLDRPIVIFEVPGAMDPYPEKDQAVWKQDHGEVVAQAGQVCPAIERGLADPGSRGEIRRWKAAQLYYRPGTATDRGGRGHIRDAGDGSSVVALRSESGEGCPLRRA